MTDTLGVEIPDLMLQAIKTDKILKPVLQLADLVDDYPEYYRIVVAKGAGHTLLKWAKTKGWDSKEFRGLMTWFLSTIFAITSTIWYPWILEPPAK